MEGPLFLRGMPFRETVNGKNTELSPVLLHRARGPLTGWGLPGLDIP